MDPHNAIQPHSSLCSNRLNGASGKSAVDPEVLQRLADPVGLHVMPPPTSEPKKRKLNSCVGSGGRSGSGRLEDGKKRISDDYDDISTIVSERGCLRSDESNSSFKKSVMAEEEYLSSLGSIISRDFFPNLHTFEQLSGYGDKMLAKDIISDSSHGKGIDWDTRSVSSLASQSERSSKNELGPDVRHLSLNKFLSEYTSGDNHSFSKLMKKDAEERRRKKPWAYSICDGVDDNRKEGNMGLYYIGNKVLSHEERERMDKALDKSFHSKNSCTNTSLIVMPQKCENLLISNGSNTISNNDSSNSNSNSSALVPIDVSGVNSQDTRPNSVDTWKFRVRNQLMFYPDLEGSNDTCGVPNDGTHNNGSYSRSIDSDNEVFKDLDTEAGYRRLCLLEDKKKKIVLKNTSLPDFDPSFEHLSSVVDDKVSESRGLSVGMEDPILALTPSPRPGETLQSPIMTWGNIAGTPLRLDGNNLADPSKPHFSIPPTPLRDELARKLDAKTRKKRADALLTPSLTSANAYGTAAQAATPIVGRNTNRSSTSSVISMRSSSSLSSNRRSDGKSDGRPKLGPGALALAARLQQSGLLTTDANTAKPFGGVFRKT
jgi:protein DGCR14